MLPYLLAVAGGYLLGNSTKEELFEKGGSVSDLGNLVGKRIRMIEMVNDPNPILPGSLGTIYNVGADVLNVLWDNGRQLGVIFGVDNFEILEK
jgi:hypothetical protein